MKFKILISIIVLFFFISLVSSAAVQINENNGYIVVYPKFETLKQGQYFNLSIKLINESDGLLISGATCFLTTLNQTGDTILEDEELSEIGKHYNYYLDTGNFSNSGISSWDIYCNTTFFGGFADGLFVVTNSGNSITQGNSITSSMAIFFFLILSILCFVSFMKSDSKPQTKWSFFLIGFMSLIVSLNLISLVLLDSLVNSSITSFLDFFVAMSFYIYWFSFGILAVIWFITILNSYLFKQKLKKDQLYGLP